MSRYEFSLRQEVLLEKGAAVLADLFWLEREQRFPAGDNPVSALYDRVWVAKRDIFSAQAEADLEQIEGEFDQAKVLLSEMGARDNA